MKRTFKLQETDSLKRTIGLLWQFRKERLSAGKSPNSGLMRLNSHYIKEIINELKGRI